ncbi:MAG: glycosyltransferase family 39 protein [Nitrospira sp.]|nr:glycosyltransferase family 39 protein [Nitrospira sp.]
MKPVERPAVENAGMLNRVLQWLDGVAETLGEVCERHWGLLLGLFSIAYFATTSVLAMRKPMWNDELFTYFIAQAPTLSGIWAALLTGADQSPFPFYVLARWSMALFGVNEWALRLPEMVGVWGAAVGLFFLVKRRSSALYGFTAMMCLLVTNAQFYSYEARPYGLVLGFAMVAWVCWAAAAEEKGRPWSLIGLWGSLSAVVGSHYYGVFVFVPLGIAECVRLYRTRRPDWLLWTAIVGGLLPLGFLWPLIQQARGYSRGFWAIPSWKGIPDTYSTLLMPAPLLFMLLLIGAGVVAYLQQGNSARRPVSALPTIPDHEWGAALAFAALPVIGVAVTLYTTGAFTARYALPTVLGISVLVSLTLFRLGNGRVLLGVAGGVLAVAGFAMLTLRALPYTAASAVDPVAEFLAVSATDELPIVVSDPHNFMMLAHYAPRGLSSRLVYLADPDASLRHMGHDTMDRGMLDLNPWFRMNVKDWRAFQQSRGRFLLYVHGGFLGGPLANGLSVPDFNWLLSDLMLGEWRLELLRRQENRMLFLVVRASGEAQQFGRMVQP